MRVRVWNGNGSQKLGHGTYLGDVPIFLFMSRDYKDVITAGGEEAEQRPPDERVKEMDQKGYLLVQEPSPKIVMDNGDVYYGAQVWWEPMEDVIDVNPLNTFLEKEAFDVN